MGWDQEDVVESQGFFEDSHGAFYALTGVG
jgi:hypothetical protein